MDKFQVGRTYYTRSICDHNCIVSMHVLARTAKTVTAIAQGRSKTLRISTADGHEEVKPWGKYSMAPTIDSTDLEILKPDWEK